VGQERKISHNPPASALQEEASVICTLLKGVLHVGLRLTQHRIKSTFAGDAFAYCLISRRRIRHSSKLFLAAKKRMLLDTGW
jgi:hypothetical protein